ncbi:polymerase family protein [Arthroderma uncinatum]|uniref:polymerase family protein n=1 Tax=Arthroderma uncinatum TaxID=74035 RepID=UPI00144A7B4B|nr:polymerase family protein [Arthroderma uncinatum]KAF3491430.1 polymerase family protein [Arthroderma uncinatum]
MPRKAFIRDLKEASAPGAFSGLTNVKPGEDDGTLSCSLTLSESPQQSVNIEFMVTDISLYPEGHEFLIYTTSDDVPKYVTEVLGQAQRGISRLEIPDMLSQLSYNLQKKLKLKAETGDAIDDNCDIQNDGEATLFSEVEDPLADFNDDGDGWSPDSEQPNTQGSCKSKDLEYSEDEMEELVYKLSVDLKTTKLAGFRVGYLGHKTTPIVSLSCRISKLGISEDAMKAWHVKEQQYLVCLIRYIGKYQSFEELLLEDQETGKSSVEMRVGLCDVYKPTLESALIVFGQVGLGGKTSMAVEAGGGEMVHSFISKPLNALLNERFVKILRYRNNFGQTWSGAERFFNEFQGKPIGNSDPVHTSYQEPDIPEEKAATFPDILKSDHFMETKALGASFPLITMQFTLRHFVRCTEFCLVCHCKTNDTFEAIKPYVCSKSLCLFQYMTLGFGPSLEWEIIAQPYVVDLLISFTYSSAFRGRIVDMPTGLGLLVPAGIVEARNPHLFGNFKLPSPDEDPISHRGVVYFDRSTMAMKFPINYSQDVRRVRVGDWLVVLDGSDHLHCRVIDASTWPIVELSDPINVSTRPAASRSLAPPKSTSGFKQVLIVWYDQNFDNLSERSQHFMIVTLLDTLPTVTEMKEYLMENSRGSHHTLGNWKNRISKPALDILRWIVASNRSCIIQDDPDPTDNDTVTPIVNSDRVGGIAGYMQFRLAQGAPDKEERFSQAVMFAKERLKKRQATLFAWHGSHLSNWHGILREGLHFKEIVNGRAYGNGVYMSPYFSTSAGYVSAATSWDPLSGPHSGTETWPGSKLGVCSAISLNEVVNCPEEFVSTAPHLVISQLDWIQARYLFVRCSLNKDMGTYAPAATNQLPYYEQDPSYVAQGPDHKPIIIPLSAFSQQRRLALGIRAGNPPPEKPNVAPGIATMVDTTTAAPVAEVSPTPSKRQKLFIWTGNSFSKGVGAEPKDVDSENSDPNSPTRAHIPDQAPRISPLPTQMDADGYISEDTDVEDLDIIIRANDIDIKRASRKQPQEAPKDISNGKDKGKCKAQNETHFIPGILNPATLPVMAAPTYATPSATASLQRELRVALRTQENEPLADLGWYIDPNLINTVYQWIVELHSFDPSLPLAKDMQMADIKSVVLELRFPQQYPISPPFVRVIRPRFLGFQSGGGGHVTAGGALCMELLTNSGWSAVSSIESVLLQVRMAISSTEPQPARLVSGQDARRGKVMDYGVGEAVEAYIRACRMHGWQIPADFEQEAKCGWIYADDSTSRN